MTFWKQVAIDELRDYDSLKRSISIIRDEINGLESKFTAIRSAISDGTPVQGGGNGREDALLSNLVRQEELRKNLENAKLYCHLVEEAMDALSPDERLVLDRFYIHPCKCNVDRLCGELGLEKSAVYYRRDAALRNYTLARYGPVRL